MNKAANNPQKTESKQELINRLLKKAALDYKCCGGGGRCKVITK